MDSKSSILENLIHNQNQRLPNHFLTLKIKEEILKITEEKDMNNEEKIDFLFAVIQQQATELESLRKKELKHNFETEKLKLTDKIVQCYQNKVDLSNDREWKDQYLELGEIIEEMVKVDKQTDKLIMILNDLK